MILDIDLDLNRHCFMIMTLLSAYTALFSIVSFEKSFCN